MKTPYYIGFYLLLLAAFGLAGLYGQQQEQLNIAKDDRDNKNEGVPLASLAQIQGVRSNQLLGYGLVVGLSGTGDTRSNFASTAIQNLLSGLGQKLEKARLARSRNIAAVLVTAEAPSFIRVGARLNATVSSIGDARSLKGGILIQTPLYAGDRNIYAVAQGALSAGGKDESGTNIGGGKTVASLLNGAVIEKEMPGSIFDASAGGLRQLRVSLRSFNFSTLHVIYEKLKSAFPEANVQLEGGSLLLDIPTSASPVAFISEMEKLRVKPQRPARVVINERSGTIVMGGDVRVDPVAISRKGMDVTVSAANRTANIGARLGQQGAQASDAASPVNTRQFSGSNLNEIIQALNKMGRVFMISSLL